MQRIDVYRSCNFYRRETKLFKSKFKSKPFSNIFTYRPSRLLQRPSSPFPLPLLSFIILVKIPPKHQTVPLFTLVCMITLILIYKLNIMKSLSMCYTIKDEDSRVIFHDSRKAKSTAHYISEEHVRNPSVLINFCAAKVRLKYSANSRQTQR